MSNCDKIKYTRRNMKQISMLKNAMKLYWGLSDESKKAVWDFVKSLQSPEK